MPIDAESSPPTSASLILRVKARDENAWERLVAVYTPLVYRWCRKDGLKIEESLDLAQEVFQAVLRGIDSFEKNTEQDTFRGWLRVITKRKVVDHWRKQQRTPDAGRGGSSAQWHLGQLEQIDTPDDEAERQTDRSVLAHRILDLMKDQFKETTWKAFWFVVVDGDEPEVVAERLGISRNAVYVAKSRVLARLREGLSELDP